MSGTTPAPVYLMGHTDHERRRLSLQASVLNPLTLGFLQRAGIGPGMRVLDMGCGVGEVSMMAARLVGSNGHVTGIDIDPAALEIARVRARENGFHQISFEACNVAEHRPERLYDAVIGRHILIHCPDALEALRKVAGLVRSGGIVAFQEYDLSRYIPGYPAMPLHNRVSQMFADLFNRATPHADIGIRLFHLMQEAGLPAPDTRAECVIGGGAGSNIQEWFAETVRSVLPKLEALGLATAADLDIETLADRLRDESIAYRTGILSPMMVGAFSRKP